MFSSKNLSNFVFGQICSKSKKCPEISFSTDSACESPHRIWKSSQKKSSSFELSLSEIRRFSKIRNHDVFQNLNYINFKLTIYFRIENSRWFLIFENCLISDSDNSKLEDFFGMIFNCDVGIYKLNLWRKKFLEISSILNIFVQIQSLISFLKKTSTCANANTPDFDPWDLFFMLNKSTKFFLEKSKILQIFGIMSESRHLWAVISANGWIFRPLGNCMFPELVILWPITSARKVYSW